MPRKWIYGSALALILMMGAADIVGFERSNALRNLMSAFDLNGDGVITSDEAAAAAERKFGELDADDNGRLDTLELTVSGDHAGLFDDAAAKSGGLTKAEFIAAVKRQFAKADQSRDGELDRNELSSRNGSILLDMIRDKPPQTAER